MKIEIFDKTKKKQFIEALSGFGLNERLIMPNNLIKSYSSPSVVSAILGTFIL